MRNATLALLAALPLSMPLEAAQNEPLQRIVSNLRACVRAHASLAQAAGVLTRNQAVEFFRAKCSPALSKLAPADVGAIPPGLFSVTIGDEWGAVTR